MYKGEAAIGRWAMGDGQESQVPVMESIHIDLRLCSGLRQFFGWDKQEWEEHKAVSKLPKW